MWKYLKREKKNSVFRGTRASSKCIYLVRRRTRSLAVAFELFIKPQLHDLHFFCGWNSFERQFFIHIYSLFKKKKGMSGSGSLLTRTWEFGFEMVVSVLNKWRGKLMNDSLVLDNTEKQENWLNREFTRLT